MRMLLRAMRNARHPLGMALYIAVMRYLLQQIAQDQSQKASHELSRKEKVHAAISSVLSLKFVQQFDTWKSFEQQHSGTEVHLFGALYGPTEVAP